MFKFVIAFFITVFLSACGVDTSSSASESGNEVSTDSDLVVSNTIDPNPIMDVSDGSDGTDSSDSSDDPIETVNPNISDFDTVGAIEDSNACNSNYNIVNDASYGGELDGENGANGAIANDQGLVIRSEYLSQDYQSTWVMLYYNRFPTFDDLNQQGSQSYTMDNVFNLSYDLAWVDESIEGIDNIVYVQSEKTEKPSCYRLTLNSITGSEIDVQKVYRVRL